MSKNNEIPTHLRLRRIDETAIVAKLRWLNRWGPLMLIGVILGAFYIGMAVAGFGVAPGLVAAGVFGVMLLVCLGRRSQIEIHVKNRTYRQEGGVWPLLRVRQGRLAEFDRVELAIVNESAAGLAVRATVSHVSLPASYYVLRLRGRRHTLALEARSWGFEPLVDLADALCQELDLPLDNQVRPENA